MPNYQNGKFYKIVDNYRGNIYIGSTTIGLRQRLAGHVNTFNKYKKRERSYTSSFAIIKNCNYDIVLLENYPCNNKEELHARERFHIEHNICVNKK